jgi:hypothetical protein
MKKLLLFGLILSLTFSISAQQSILSPTDAKAYHFVKADEGRITVSEFTKTPAMPAFKSVSAAEEEIIGGTRYDLQTNVSIQNRVHVFPDGTAGAVWTMGMEDNAYPDRGSGYNYFDGTAWGPEPEERIESLRTGWPSYAPYGENGEVVVSHDFAVGSLYYLTRDEKGAGEWTEDEFLGPDGFQISWNRAMTSGVDRSVLHMIYVTWTGALYEGMDGALLYSRTSDGGQSWDYENELLDGMTADEYIGITADNYAWADAKGDNIAFLVGDYWMDLFMMKSTDGGDTWTKTVIWEHPYQLYDFTYATDTFYCVDGAFHLAFDSENKVHVVFGINQTVADEGGAWGYYSDLDGGIGYWNEDMPVFSDDVNALSPFGDPGSEMVQDYNWIGWSPDVDGDGQVTFEYDFGLYNVGISSQPQIVIDDMDYVYVVYSAGTETFNNGTLNFRHIWARGSWAEGVWGPLMDLTEDLVHIFDECVYPTIASATDDYFYLTYQTDSEPGVNIQGTAHFVTDNDIYFMKIPRNELIPLDVEEQDAPVREENVSQNYPNPFNGNSVVKVNVSKSCTLGLEVTNLAGQVVYALPERKVDAGTKWLEIKSDHLPAGVYFYSVKADDTVVTKKMVIE